MSIDNSNEQPGYVEEIGEIGKIQSIKIVGFRMVNPTGTPPTEEQLRAFRLRNENAQRDLAQTTLKDAAQAGFIQFEKVHRILDFGSGFGGASSGLIEFTREYTPHIDLIEKEQEGVEYIRSSGIVSLPPENILHEDGITYLQSLESRRIPPYDLITAFGFSHGSLLDTEGFRSLAASASRALSPMGNLLITSGLLGMYQALRVSREASVPFHFWEEVRDRKTLVRPPTLILPQSSLSIMNPTA